MANIHVWEITAAVRQAKADLEERTHGGTLPITGLVQLALHTQPPHGTRGVLHLQVRPVSVVASVKRAVSSYPHLAAVKIAFFESAGTFQEAPTYAPGKPYTIWSA